MTQEHITTDHDWGNELVLQNNSNYSIKRLECFRKHWSSRGLFRYHKYKDKTFYVISGFLVIHYTTKTNTLSVMVLKEGESYRIQPWTQYRFTAVNCKKCIFLEISTPCNEDDTFVIVNENFEV